MFQKKNNQEIAEKIPSNLRLIEIYDNSMIVRIK